MKFRWAILTLVLMAGLSAYAEVEKLGSVEFPNSGAAEARDVVDPRLRAHTRG